MDKNNISTIFVSATIFILLICGLVSIGSCEKSNILKDELSFTDTINVVIDVKNLQSINFIIKEKFPDFNIVSKNVINVESVGFSNNTITTYELKLVKKLIVKEIN